MLAKGVGMDHKMILESAQVTVALVTESQLGTESSYAIAI